MSSNSLVLRRNYNNLALNPLDAYALANRNSAAVLSVNRDFPGYNPYNTPGTISRQALRNRRQRLNRRVNNQNVLFPRNNPFNSGIINRRGNIPAGARFRAIQNRFYTQGNAAVFSNGGYVAPSMAVTTNSMAPIASGFSISNSGERNVTFSKEFVAGFLKLSDDDKQFKVYQITTHPSLNASVVAISQIYQRYKILSYQFKYKASCPTVTSGIHFTGVDYGTQTNLPSTFTEAESLEHFSVGPIWKDSQNWHELKMANLRERWFDTNVNSSDPDSRPARIIFGALGVNDVITSSTAYGLVEVRVTYLFNGLAQRFTGSPPSKITQIQELQNTKELSNHLDNEDQEMALESNESEFEEVPSQN